MSRDQGSHTAALNREVMDWPLKKLIDFPFQRSSVLSELSAKVVLAAGPLSGQSRVCLVSCGSYCS